MKKSKNILVAVSALALRAVLPTQAALAQVVVSCPVAVNMGVVAPCGSGGRYRLNPNGNTNLQSGCLAIVSKAMVGQCFVKSGGIPVTKSVQIDFPDNRVTASNGLGDTLTYRRWRINDGAGNNDKLTVSATAVNNTVTVNVAARIHFNANQPLGVYSTVNTITAVEIP